MSGVRGFRDIFKSYTPRWLQNRWDPTSGALLNAGYRMLYSMIFPLDVAVQAIVEGMKAAWPGSGGTPSALPVVGSGRGMIQGENESDDTFIARLVQWLSSWDEDGSYPHEQLARELQAYLGTSPTVRVVDRQGMWTSIDPSGNATFVEAAWDWDSVSNPERAAYWSDLWIIVYPCDWTQAPTILARSTDNTHRTGFGFGHLVDRRSVDEILSIIAARKGTHTSVRAIVWSYDSTLCVPGGSNNPDGTWGAFSKISGGPYGTRVAARSANARYWTPTTL